MDISGTHASIWQATAPTQQYPTLAENMAVDIAIVGGGITGITAAVLLKRAGKKVAVFEADRIGSGVTGRTTAHLTEILDTRYQTLMADHGRQQTRQIAAASRAAIEQIADLVDQYQVDCDFRRVPGFLYTESAADRRLIEQEVDVARSLGIAAHVSQDVPLPFPIQIAAQFDNQAQFHVLKYLHALAQHIPGEGSHLFEMTRVLNIDDSSPCRLETRQGVVTAQAVVLATHAPIHDLSFLSGLLPLVQTRIFPYRSYVLGIRLKQPHMQEGLYWDTAEPYHYIRTHTDEQGQVLIVGGADHKTGHTIDTHTPYQELITYTHERFDLESIDYHWSAQVYESGDGLPLIGRAPLASNIYVSTGYSGNGMTFGTLGGMVLADILLGRTNPWVEFCDPSRITPSGIDELIVENVDVAKHFVVDRGKQDVDELVAIPPDEGRIMNINGKQYAVYRDKQGNVHTFSPVCTHVHCIVTWNTAEKTWDCPCHGGRFDAMGFVLNGPPVMDLEPGPLM